MDKPEFKKSQGRINRWKTAVEGLGYAGKALLMSGRIQIVSGHSTRKLIARLFINNWEHRELSKNLYKLVDRTSYK